jgi:hypothetical protein
MALHRFGLPLTALLLTSAFLPAAYADSLEIALAKAAPNANAKVIALAVRATQCTRAQGAARAETGSDRLLTAPSTEQRLWVFDLKTQTALSRTRRPRPQQRRKHGHPIL